MVETDKDIKFLSTLSLRRATQLPLLPQLHLRFLSTLSLRRATICPRTRVDHARQFLSTLSLRRATAQAKELGIVFRISIHALLAESDKP